MSQDLNIVNGDLVLASSGDLQLISGQKKLIQDILKICLTKVGSNPFNQWYGSFLSQSLIGSSLDSSILTSVAKTQLQNALENLQKLQKLQSQNSAQNVTPDEQIAGIKSIQVTQNPNDPRGYQVFIKVINRAFQQTIVSFPATS